MTKKLKDSKELKEDSSDDIPHEKKKYRTEGINIEFNPNRKVIAMYVRRGAKGVEMALKPFKDYADAALILSKNGLMNVSTSINSNRSNSTDTNSSTYEDISSKESESFNLNNNNVHDDTAHKEDSVTALAQLPSSPISPLSSSSLSSSYSSSSPPPPSLSSSPSSPPLLSPPPSSSHAPNRIHEIALKPIIFLGTEDPEVIDEALEWGHRNHWQASFQIIEVDVNVDMI